MELNLVVIPYLASKMMTALFSPLLVARSLAAKIEMVVELRIGEESPCGPSERGEHQSPMRSFLLPLRAILFPSLPLVLLRGS